MSREELISMLVSRLAACSSEGARADDATRLLHDLQVQQVDLELENRGLREVCSELQESLDRYADLYDAAPVPYFSLDESGVIRDLNLNAARLLGQERGRVLGHPLTRFLRLKQPSVLWKHFAKCAVSQQPETAELSFHAEERQYDVEMLSVVKPGLEGAPSEPTFRSVFVDITLRRCAEHELRLARASERSLRAQIEAVDRAQAAVSAALAEKDDAQGLRNVVGAILREAIGLTEARYAEVQFVDGVDYGPQAARRFSRGQATDQPCTHLNSVLAFGGQDLGVLSVYRERCDHQVGEEEAKGKLEMYAGRISSALEVARLQVLARREWERPSLLASIASVEEQGAAPRDRVLRVAPRRENP